MAGPPLMSVSLLASAMVLRAWREGGREGEERVCLTCAGMILCQARVTQGKGW